MPFINQAVLVSEDGDTVDVVAETTTCLHVVIAPVIETRPDGRCVLGGGLALVHAPTGRSITRGSSNDRLHSLATRLAKFDWSFTDRAEFLAEPSRASGLREIFREWGMNAGDAPSYWMCDPNISPAMQLARSADPSRQMLVEQLDRWMKLDECRPEIPAAGGDGAAWMNWLTAEVYGYGVCYLMAVLRAIDPAVAAVAANDLGDAWDAGDSFGEWVWQWRDELARDLPLTLHGIPALNDFTSSNTCLSALVGSCSRLRGQELKTMTTPQILMTEHDSAVAPATTGCVESDWGAPHMGGHGLPGGPEGGWMVTFAYPPALMPNPITRDSDPDAGRHGWLIAHAVVKGRRTGRSMVIAGPFNHADDHRLVDDAHASGVLGNRDDSSSLERLEKWLHNRI